jgi:hypothetical protein
MRNFGGILMILGILGFFYSASQMSKYDPVPDGLSIGDAMKLPSGRWDVGRYVCAAAGGFGFLMALYPKGR